ncbi:MAG: VTT domain-containing protein [Micrococcaceae bacterium]
MTSIIALSILPDWLNPTTLLPMLGPWVIIGVLFIIFAETGLMVGFFLPGDSLLFTVGMFVATSAIKIDIYLMMLLIFLAAFCGNQTGYFIGRKAGPAIFNKPDSLLFKREHVDKTHAFFEKYGGRAIVLACFVPIVRTFSPVAAGVSRMDYRKFVTFNGIGALLWGSGVTFLGYHLGRIPWVGENIDKIFLGIVFVSVLPIISELYKSNKEQKQNTASKANIEE